MARPQKQGLDYFALDTDFDQDTRIYCACGECGVIAEFVAIKLLCAIYRSGYFLKWSKAEKYKLLRKMPMLTADELDRIICSLVEWEFFDRQLFEKEGVLTSADIQQRYFAAVKRRAKQTSLPYLIIDQPEADKAPTPAKPAKPAKEAKGAAEPSGAEPTDHRDFQQQFFDPSRRTQLEAFCMSLGLKDDEQFSQLRALVADADSCLCLCDDPALKSYTSWARSVQNMARRAYFTRKSQTNNYSSYNENGTPTNYSGGYQGQYRGQYKSAAERNLPVEPLCGLHERPANAPEAPLLSDILKNMSIV